jgi:hypothetical protein
VRIVLSSQDQKTTENEGWVNVTLEIEGVKEFVLVEGKTTSGVLSSGLSIGFFDGKIHLAIDEEAESLDEFKKSNFLVIGERCTWAVSSYDETSKQP